MSKQKNVKIQELENLLSILSQEAKCEIRGGIDAAVDPTVDYGTATDTTSELAGSPLPTRRGWFFLRSLQGEKEKIKFKDDNACPSIGYFHWKNSEA